MPIRITDVREITQPISSPIRNAYIDFSKMTTSLVAVVTNVERGGRPVVGYGFNSNGRYGQGGLIRERFAPRILEADPRSLLDASGENLDPDRVWATMMTNEKPGGHGDRSVAVGTIDMAVWDAVAKIAGRPLFRLLAERHGIEADPRVFVYAAGGYYYPGKDTTALCAEMRSYLDRGYTVVKMKIGGETLDDDRRRIEAVLREIGSSARLAVDANGRFDLATAIDYARMLRPYDLFWYEEPGHQIANPCFLARIPEEELIKLFEGLGYKPYLVSGHDPAAWSTSRWPRPWTHRSPRSAPSRARPAARDFSVGPPGR